MTRTARPVRFLAGTALALALATPAFAQSSTGESQTPPAATQEDMTPQTGSSPDAGSTKARGSAMDSGAADSGDRDATSGTTQSTADEMPDAAPSMDNAQGTPTGTPTGTDTTTSAGTGIGTPTEPILTTQQPGQLVSDEIIGTDVRNPEDESIGTIDALVLDTDNRVVAGIVSVGGFLGIGAKDVAVNWNEFEFQPEEEVAMVTLSREQLENAPAFRETDDVRAQVRTEEQRLGIERQQDRLEEQATPPADAPAAAE